MVHFSPAGETRKEIVPRGKTRGVGGETLAWITVLLCDLGQ